MNIGEHTTAITIAVVAVIVLLAIVVFSKPIRNFLEQFRVNRAIKRMGTILNKLICVPYLYLRNDFFLSFYLYYSKGIIY